MPLKCQLAVCLPSKVCNVGEATEELRLEISTCTKVCTSLVQDFYPWSPNEKICASLEQNTDSRVDYLPIVLSTWKPKPLSDLAALCISASFLPNTDCRLMIHIMDENYKHYPRITKNKRKDRQKRSKESYLVTSRCTKFNKFHNNVRATCWQ